MAEIKINWVACEDISIRDSALECGFNLSTLDLYSLNQDRLDWVVNTVSKHILDKVDSEWGYCNPKSKLGDIKNGLYVISFGGGICLNYSKGQSQVLYIGKGSVKARIKAHLGNWIMHFSESLQDMCLTFHVTTVVVKNSKKPHGEVEYDFIEKFKEKFGEKPILNKNKGTYHSKTHSYSAKSLRPLNKKKRISYGWKISPMPKNDWFREL